MKALLPVLALLAGCVSAPQKELPFHSFERQLYVANSEIPHLALSEWESIRRSFQQRVGDEFEFRYAIRLEPALVRVDLVRKKNPENEGLSLFFEKKNERWEENRAKAEETVRLIPFHE